VRNVMNTVLIALVSAALVAAPVLAAPSPASTPSAPLGIVVQADNAHVGTDRTYSGETIYDGDRLETPQGSTMRLQFGAEQMILRQSSSAQLHAIANGFSANLAGGSVVVSSAAGQTFELYADGATIRPATADPVSGQITVISPKELVLTSTRGVLKVTMGEEVKTVEAGSSYRMELESDDSAASPQQSASPTARNRMIWIVIPAVAAVTGIVIWRALVSPSS
jgi:hypothetical protein